MNRAWLFCAFLLAAGCERKTTELSKATLDASAPTVTPVAHTAMPTATAKKPISTRDLGATMGVKCNSDVLAGLKPAKPVDYLELRVELENEVVREGSVGKQCAHATDARRCEEAIENAKPPVPLGQNAGCAAANCPSNEYIVWQRGDDVGAVTGKDVAAFLAPIDTASDAAATLAYSLAASTMPERETQGSADCNPRLWSQTADGWQSGTTTSADGSTRQFFVKRDGSFSVRDTPGKR